MAAIEILLIASAVVVLFIFRGRFETWARKEREAGRTTRWTRTLRPPDQRASSSLTAAYGARIGIPIAVAAIIGGFVIRGGAGLVLLALAAVAVIAVYALRMRA